MLYIYHPLDVCFFLKKTYKKSICLPVQFISSWVASFMWNLNLQVKRPCTQSMHWLQDRGNFTDCWTGVFLPWNLRLQNLLVLISPLILVAGEGAGEGPLDFKWQGFLLYQLMLSGNFWGSEMLHGIFWGLISDPGIFLRFCLKP